MLPPILFLSLSLSLSTSLALCVCVFFSWFIFFCWIYLASVATNAIFARRFFHAALLTNSRVRQQCIFLRAGRQIIVQCLKTHISPDEVTTNRFLQKQTVWVFSVRVSRAIAQFLTLASLMPWRFDSYRNWSCLLNMAKERHRDLRHLSKSLFFFYRNTWFDLWETFFYRLMI